MIVRLSEHFQCGSFVRADVAAVATALASEMSRFGPIETTAVSDTEEVLAFLLPATSFSSRYAVLKVGAWAAIAVNGFGNDVHSESLNLARRLGCRRAFGRWKESGRSFEVSDETGQQRCISLIDEGSRWSFFASGDPLPFEAVARCNDHRKRDRLSPAMVLKYLEVVTDGGFSGDWRPLLAGGGMGIVRSTHEVRVPIHEFETVVDI